MRFTDIPKFIDGGSYAIDVSIRYLLETIDRWIDENGLQLNPDFQRGHVWNIGQERAYVEYILRGGQSSRDIWFNHPGWMRDFKGDFVCVDGLQRLTALRLFLQDHLQVFPCEKYPRGLYCSDFEDRLTSLNSLRFHVNNLQTKKEVLQWYIEMNSGGTPHSDEEIERVQKMLEACDDE